MSFSKYRDLNGSGNKRERVSLSKKLHENVLKKHGIDDSNIKKISKRNGFKLKETNENHKNHQGTL